MATSVDRFSIVLDEFSIGLDECCATVMKNGARLCTHDFEECDHVELQTYVSNYRIHERIQIFIINLTHILHSRKKKEKKYIKMDVISKTMKFLFF